MFKCLLEYRPPVVIRDLNKIYVPILILLSEIQEIDKGQGNNLWCRASYNENQAVLGVA